MEFISFSRIVAGVLIANVLGEIVMQIENRILISPRKMRNRRKTGSFILIITRRHRFPDESGG